MALTANRQPGHVYGERRNYPVAAGAHIYSGSGVVLNASGYAVAPSAAIGLVSVGFAVTEQDNTAGADGALRIEVFHDQVSMFENSASSDAITIAEIGDVCYWVDGGTVAKTSASGTRSIAGVIDGPIEGTRVGVRLGVFPPVSGLVAANNLSDVGSAATARSNLGANKLVVYMGEASSKASDAAVLYAGVPVAGTIKKLKTIIVGALATADATVQLQYGATVGALANVGSTTTGRATITQAGSATGDVDTASPLTTNIAVAEDGVLKAVVAGGSTATGTVKVYVEIDY